MMLQEQYDYRVYGQTLRSNLELPHLITEGFGKSAITPDILPDILIEHTPAKNDLALITQGAKLLIRHVTALGGYLGVYEDPAGYLLHWEGRYCFHLARQGHYIQLRQPLRLQTSDVGRASAHPPNLLVFEYGPMLWEDRRNVPLPEWLEAHMDYPRFSED